MPDFVTYKDYANGTLEASGNRLTLVKTGLAVGLARDLVVAEGVVVTYAVEFSQWNSQRNCAWFGVADVTSAQPKGWTIDGHGQIFEMDLAHLNSDTDQEWNLYLYFCTRRTHAARRALRGLENTTPLSLFSQ